MQSLGIDTSGLTKRPRKAAAPADKGVLPPTPANLFRELISQAGEEVQQKFGEMSEGLWFGTRKKRDSDNEKKSPEKAGDTAAKDLPDLAVPSEPPVVPKGKAKTKAKAKAKQAPSPAAVVPPTATEAEDDVVMVEGDFDVQIKQVLAASKKEAEIREAAWARFEEKAIHKASLLSIGLSETQAVAALNDGSFRTLLGVDDSPKTGGLKTIKEESPADKGMMLDTIDLLSTPSSRPQSVKGEQVSGASPAASAFQFVKQETALRAEDEGHCATPGRAPGVVEPSPSTPGSILSRRELRAMEDKGAPGSIPDYVHDPTFAPSAGLSFVKMEATSAPAAVSPIPTVKAEASLQAHPYRSASTVAVKPKSKAKSKSKSSPTKAGRDRGKRRMAALAASSSSDGSVGGNSDSSFYISSGAESSSSDSDGDFFVDPSSEDEEERAFIKRELTPRAVKSRTCNASVKSRTCNASVKSRTCNASNGKRTTCSSAPVKAERGPQLSQTDAQRLAAFLAPQQDVFGGPQMEISKEEVERLWARAEARNQSEDDEDEEGMSAIDLRVKRDIQEAAGHTGAIEDNEENIDLSSSPLHALLWGRIVLDEAHRIKGRTTSTAKSVFALKVWDDEPVSTMRTAVTRTSAPLAGPSVPGVGVDSQGDSDSLEDSRIKGERKPKAKRVTAKAKAAAAAAAAAEEALKVESTTAPRGTLGAARLAALRGTSGAPEVKPEPSAFLVTPVVPKGEPLLATKEDPTANENSAFLKTDNVETSVVAKSKAKAKGKAKAKAKAKKDEEEDSTIFEDFVNLNRGTRWCLTGTPLQNRIGELYSLVRFLRVAPQGYYFCSVPGCGCRSLHYQFKNNRYCVHCDHARLKHYSHFNKHIANPIKNSGTDGAGRKALETLRNDVLAKVLLRRTKVERQEDLRLPPLTIEVRPVEMSEAETDFYKSLYMQTKTKFDTFVQKDVVLHNFAHIFDLLSRLRQAADHPYLIVYGNLSAGLPDNSADSIPAPARHKCETCGLCQDDILVDDLASDELRHRMTNEEVATNEAGMTKSKCNHFFHTKCFDQYMADALDLLHSDSAHLEGASVIGCPVCYAPLTVTLQQQAAQQRRTGNSGPTADDADEWNNPQSASPKAKGKTKAKAKAKKRSVKLEDGTQLEDDDDDQDDQGEDAVLSSAQRAKIERQLDAAVKSEIGGKVGEEEEDVGNLARNLTDLGTMSGTKGSQGSKAARTPLLSKLRTSEFQSSSKLEALVDAVRAMQREDPEAKGIVFSQYTNMLHLIEWRLKKAGFRCAMLIGGMSMAARGNLLHAFNKDPQFKIILISLKAGGEGLNLQIASNVFLMDPWWNPAAELQAIQRAHRIGQRKPVRAVRFVCKNSIEERMLELQEKKQLVFEGTVGNSDLSMSKLTSADLQFLFQN